MSCGTTIEAEVGSVVVARFISTTETNQDQTAAHIGALSTSYLLELEKLGQGNAAPGSPKITAAPYSTRLRPLSSHRRIYDALQVTLNRIEFHALDTTLAGSAYQDATTLAAITDSVTPGSASYSVNDAYMQSRFRNAHIGGWQPNFFRPRLLVNGASVLFNDLHSSYWDDDTHLGDSSIGLDIPCCVEGSILLGRVKTLDVFAQAGQIVGSVIQRYPILCTMYLTINNRDC